MTASETSNERIRQALTSAFAQSGLELKYRQVCTADQTGEVELLDVNYNMIAEYDSGFVTKPIAEGRRLINGKSANI